MSPSPYAMRETFPPELARMMITAMAPPTNAAAMTRGRGALGSSASMRDGVREDTARDRTIEGRC